MGFMGGFAERASRAVDWVKLPELPSWWRRKDKGAQRRAAATRSPGWMISFFLAIAIGAALTEFVFVMIWCIRAVGDVEWLWNYAAGSAVAGSNEWSFDLQLHMLLWVPIVAASVWIIGVSTLWLPGQLAMRGQGFFRRFSLIIVGLVCNAIIVAGAIQVQQENRVEDMRDAVVQEQVGVQSLAAIDARLVQANAELERMMNNRNAYLAQAASVGEAEWVASYVRQARATGDARLPMIERATGAARAADAMRARISTLTDQRATAAVQPAAVVEVRQRATDWLAQLSEFIGAYRIVFFAVALSAIGILATWWALGISQARALLDPTAPEVEEAPMMQNAVSEEVEKSIIAPAPEPDLDIDLPRLADWRTEDDSEFSGRQMMVDETGARLRKVGAHWRADDRPAPASALDRRRRTPLDEAAPQPVPPSPELEPEDGGALMTTDDLMAGLLANAEPAPDERVEETESV